MNIFYKITAFYLLSIKIGAFEGYFLLLIKRLC